MANQLATRIEGVLRPVVGTVLASVSVDVEAKRIGKTVETIDYADIMQISENLIGALRLVVGPDLAQSAASQVRSLV